MNRRVLRAALLLAAIGLLAAGLLAGLDALTRERIAEQRRALELRQLAAVMPKANFDNDPVQGRIAVQASRWLGRQEARVWRGRLGDAATLLVVEATAPDGYSGDIDLLIGVLADGRVSGVRVLDHRETPGLGDRIEVERDAWITGFDRRSLGDPARERWTVKRERGDFDQFAGATVTPRAVVRAVARALAFVERHGEALQAAEAGARLDFADGPEP
jgi:Na+-translocating ferredoxin:NAD+ oxidoreductase subunit G